MLWLVITEQELESTVAVVWKQGTTVYAIRSSYSGAIVHTIRSVGTNEKPVKKLKQRVIALNYTMFFAGVGLLCRISRFQQRRIWSASSPVGGKSLNQGMVRTLSLLPSPWR